MDLKVMFPLILFLLAQAATGLWWASDLSARVRTLESSNSKVVDLPVQLATINTRLDTVKDALKELKGEMRRVNPSRDN